MKRTAMLGQLSRDHWLKVSELFDQLLDLPAAQRRERARELCEENVTLYQELCRLLQHSETAQSVLDGSVGEAAQAWLSVDPPPAEPPPHPPAPEHIGPYRLCEEIGSGGMGVVYRAERSVGGFNQCVAIKLLPAQGGSRVMERFRQEQQVLASLRHPHIAQLYDGGFTADGRPYIVMEHVDGLPINDYCDSHRLAIVARVQVLLQVADTLHFAHQNLVIHRDVKPSNLLVGGNGEVKLLDFGIAKLLDQDHGDLTRTQESPMTPDYAAPEQVLGQTITVATDIYQLGVLMFQLLTGRRPYRRRPTSLLDMARMVGEEQPSVPSTAVMRNGSDADLPTAVIGDLGPAGLAHALRGDLDAIVMKALEKRPEQRYSSMATLAADLRAYLDGRPVSAHRQTPAYRFTKLMRRHPWQVASVTTIVLLLIAYAVNTTLQANRVQRALEQAQVQTRKAELVAGFLKDVFRSADPDVSGGDTVTARQLLDRNRESVLSGLKEEPAIQAELLNTLGTVYMGLGLYQDSQQMLEPALALRRAEANLDPAALADTLTQLGTAYLNLDRYDEGERLLEQAVAQFDQDAQWSAIRANALIALGEALHLQGNQLDAEALYRQALEGLATLPDTQRHAPMATALNNLGSLLLRQGKVAQASDMMSQAVAEQGRATGEQHSRYSVYLVNHADVLLSLERYPEAEAAYRQALDIQRRVLGNMHPYLAWTLRSLGILNTVVGRDAEAEAQLREALAIEEAMGGRDSANIARTLYRLGLSVANNGRLEEARAILERALAIDQRWFEADHSNIGQDLAALGRVTHELGRPEQARELFERALAILPADTLWATLAQIPYARLLLDMGEPEQALKLTEMALETRRQRLDAGHTQVVEARAWRALALVQMGRHDEGRNELQAVWPRLQIRAERDALRRAASAALQRGA